MQAALHLDTCAPLLTEAQAAEEALPARHHLPDLAALKTSLSCQRKLLWQSCISPFVEWRVFDRQHACTLLAMKTALEVL